MEKIKTAGLSLLGLSALTGMILRFLPSLGAKPTKEEREDYKRRAENYKDGKFVNQGDFVLMQRASKDSRRESLSDEPSTPKRRIPVESVKFPEDLKVSDLAITWFGHSSLLIQMHGLRILIDPILSQMASPVAFMGCKRYSKLPVTAEELPHIDLCIYTHDHYDHLDYATVRKMDSKVDHYVVPLGVDCHLRRFGVKQDKITNMAWWEEFTYKGLTIACTPARHFSGRSLNDRASSLWASFVLSDEYHRIFESGDGGYGEHFREIGRRYPGIELALPDCAQYDPRWASSHMTPEESYRGMKEAGADYIMPIHWGAYCLAPHPWDDPVRRYLRAAGEDRCIVTPRIGQTMRWEDVDQYREHWWCE